MELGQSESDIEPNIVIAATSPGPGVALPADRVDLDPAPHTVQFYEGDAALLERLSRFIGSALGAGDAVVVIATEAHRNGLGELLRARGLDVDLAKGQGRYVSMDAGETLSEILVDGWPDEARFTDIVGRILARAAAAAAVEKPRVAVFGEMVALLWAQGRHDAAIRLEELWNTLTHEGPFHRHCAYPMESFRQVSDGEFLSRICEEHAQVVPAESYTSLAGDEEKQLRAVAMLQQRAQALETEIEAHRKAKAALRSREAELRQAIAARDQFLAVAAHELKTPITSLRAFVQLLLRDAHQGREVAPERLESALGVIELQTGKLTDLVRRLLYSAQIESGRLRIEPVRIDLAELVRSAVVEYQDSYDCVVVFDGPEHLETTVDPIRFEQVVVNLVDNAAKFSPEGGIVTVELWQQGDGGTRLAVTDQGVGIPPDHRAEIFERSHGPRIEDHRSGLGLGLYIAQAIVEAHGGAVRIDDPEQGGSRFVVALPAPAEEVQAPAA
jgi:signal transduction histidine kinase